MKREILTIFLRFFLPIFTPSLYDFLMNDINYTFARLFGIPILALALVWFSSFVF